MGFNLLWHLSKALSANALVENSILYLLEPSFSPKGIVDPITGKYYHSTQLLSG